MRRFAKRAFLHVARAVGLFRVAERLTRRSLRIVCFHGLSLEDEHEFRPMLFMRPSTYRKRLAIIARRGLPVLALDAAVSALHDGTMPDRAVVLTFDDGFHDNFVHAIGPLVERGFPATIYVTTYYVVKGTPVFRLVVSYMAWKSARRTIDLRGIPGAPAEALVRSGTEAAERALWSIIRYAEESLSEDDRVALSRELARRFDVDYDHLARGRHLSLMTADELRHAAAAGIDLQLHTHRHRSPHDGAALLDEIGDNRDALRAIVGSERAHFCYPSGVWSVGQWPYLRQAGVVSATTCDPGLNDAGTSPLGLRRFLDGESVSSIEFEAELSGFAELMRATLRPRTGRNSSETPADERPDARP